MAKAGRKQEPDPTFFLETDLKRLSMAERGQLDSVYVICPEGKTPCKIGRARAPGRRLSNLQIGHWQELNLFYIGYVYGRNVSEMLEAAVHAFLKKNDRHIRGEWFDIRAEVASQIIAMVAKQHGIDVFIKNEEVERIAAESMARIPLATSPGMTEEEKAFRLKWAHARIEEMNIDKKNRRIARAHMRG